MTEHRTLLDCGEHAVLVEVGGLDEVLAFAYAVREAVAARAAGFADVVEIVPAATTVLVVVRDEAPVAPLRQALAALPVATGGAVAKSDQEVEIPVHYDGEDLTEVARLTGLDVRDVITAHTRSEWRVAFCGFAPGFAYCTAEPPLPATTRRDDPRTEVPAGAVGLAGPYCGIYPTRMPGGWQLIGTTSEVMFDSNRRRPALLSPGDRVRFESLG
jgi:KipI family sensor histidine kinase inhibitor